MLLTRRYRFEAARRLDRLPPSHPCSRLHGSSFSVVVQIEGEPDDNVGWIMDFADLDAVVGKVIGRLDHRYLNEIAGLESPTTERLTRWLFDALKAELKGLRRVEVWESPDSGCILTG